MARPTLAPTWTDHFQPGFVGRAPDGHAADVNELEATLLEDAGLVGRVEALQHHVEVRSGCHAPGVARLS
jgi:hypothetical protein